MADVARVSPPNHGIIHHAVTPLYTNKSDAEIRDIFDRFGRAVYGYGTANYVHPQHYRPDNGAVTHAQVQFAIRPYTKDNNKYGYRMTELMRDVEGSVTWGAGNWEVNRRAVQVEFCMDARKDRYNDKAFMLVADTWRKYDKKVNGAFNVFGHSQVSQLGTQCPAWLLEKIDLIIDMINRPDYWNAKLWPKTPAKPAPKPTPTPAPKPVQSKLTYKPIKAKKVQVNGSGKKLWNFNFEKWADAKAVKPFATDEVIDVVAIATNALGGEYYMTAYSYNNGKIHATQGVNTKDVRDYIPEPPKPTPVITTKEETITTALPYETILRDSPILNKGERKLISAGVNGERTIVYKVTYTDGKETGRSVVSNTITKQPIDELTYIGTFEPPVAPPTPPRDDEQDAQIGALQAAVGGIIQLLKSIGEAIMAFVTKSKK